MPRTRNRDTRALVCDLNGCRGLYRPGGLCSAGHHSDADRASRGAAVDRDALRRAGQAAASNGSAAPRRVERNVRATPGSSAATGYARTASGLTDNQNNSEYYALLREGEHLPDPSPAEVDAWLDGLAARVRSDSTLSATVRENTLARIEDAKNGHLPDGAMFHAWKNIEDRARQRRAAVDEVYGQFSRMLGVPASEVEKIAKRHMKVARAGGRDTAAPSEWVRTFEETGPEHVPTDRITLYAFHQLAVEGRRRRGEDVPEPALRAVRREPVESSFVRSVGYDPERRMLEIEMNGNVYQYEGVPSYVHEAVMNADSVGGAYNRYVKNQYPMYAMGPVSHQCEACGQFVGSSGHTDTPCPAQATQSVAAPVASIVEAADLDAVPSAPAGTEPAAEPPVVDSLRSSTPQQVLVAACTTQDEDAVRWIAENGDDNARLALASRLDLSDDVRGALAADENAHVRRTADASSAQALAQHSRRCPDCAAWITAYAEHSCPGNGHLDASRVQRGLNGVGGVNAEHFARDPEYRTVAALSANDAPTARAVAQALPYNEARRLVYDPALPAEMVTELARNPMLRSAALIHPNAPATTLAAHAVSGDEFEEVARAHANWDETAFNNASLRRSTARRYRSDNFHIRMPNASQVRTMMTGRDAVDSLDVPVQSSAFIPGSGRGNVTGDVRLTRRGRTAVGSGEALRCDCGQFSDGSPCDHVNRAVQAVELLTNSRQVRTALAGLGSADAAAAAELSADRRSSQERRASARRGARQSQDPHAPVVWADPEMAALVDRMVEQGHAGKSWATDDDDTFQETFQAAYELGKERKQRGESPVGFIRENATGGLGARDGGRSFGVEIEIDYVSDEPKHVVEARIGRALHAAGYTSTADKQQWRAAARTGWRRWSFEFDRTVDAEVVSPIMYDDPECWAELEDVCRILRENGAVASLRTGSHVHIGVGDYDHTVENYNHLIAEYHRNEDVLHRIAMNPQAEAHRSTLARQAGARQDYCAPNPEPRGMSVADVRVDHRNQGGHYSAVNLGAALDGSEKAHAEFRMWDGTLDPGVIQAQITASLGMAQAAFTDGRPLSPGERQAKGTHRERNQRGTSLEGDAWKEQTRTAREFADRVGGAGNGSEESKLARKAQLMALFGATKWAR